MEIRVPTSITNRNRIYHLIRVLSALSSSFQQHAELDCMREGRTLQILKYINSIIVALYKRGRVEVEKDKYCFRLRSAEFSQLKSFHRF